MARLHWSGLVNVQRQARSFQALEGKDVLATAQTGTGRLSRSLIPVIEKAAHASKSRNRRAGARSYARTGDAGRNAVQTHCAQASAAALVVGGCRSASSSWPSATVLV